MDSGGQKKLLKLSEESLMREPEEVFDLLEKIGEGYVHYPMCINIIRQSISEFMCFQATSVGGSFLFREHVS